MKLKYYFSVICFTLLFSFTAYAAVPVQTVPAFSDTESAVEINGSKIITDIFSFKLTDKWKDSCIVVQEDDILKLYEKTFYEKDGSGLLFTIFSYEGNDYAELSDCTVLGFCGHKTYLLENSYLSQDKLTSSKIRSLKKLEKNIVQTFVTFITEETLADDEP